METKGTAVMATREFVKSKFGADGLKKWVESMPEKSAKLYQGAIMLNSWYDLRDALVVPTEKIKDLFYAGDPKGAWELGRFSADYGLKGIYRLFISMASPQFIISKAGGILPTYYNPSRIETEKTDTKGVMVKITQFPEIHEILESRIGGWMERALELCGCNGVKVDKVKAMTKGHSETVYDIKWN